VPFDDLVQEGAVGLVRAVEGQREVMVHRYGLCGDLAQSHEAIGVWLGVGRSAAARSSARRCAGCERWPSRSPGAA
jgi:hypothetical protein